MIRRELIRAFRELRAGDVALVGGKNASLGEMISKLSSLGVRVPDGFAVTTDAYRLFLEGSNVGRAIADILASVDRRDAQALAVALERVRTCILTAPMPASVADEVRRSYAELSATYGEDATDVAVRSSATSEHLPDASFAGQQDTYLNVRGGDAVVDCVRRAYASLFTPRAIHYRLDMGFDDSKVALSVGVQKMVRSDLASAGVIFTLDPDTGHRGVVLVTSSYGLGESIVQGRVAPDQLFVHKGMLESHIAAVHRKKIGSKETRVVYDSSGIREERVPDELRERISISDADALLLARWALAIEKHYTHERGKDTPMDLEWAKDGRTGELFIVQARPETVHSRKARPLMRIYEIEASGEVLVDGLAVGDGVASGAAQSIRDPKKLGEFKPGDVLVTETTDPDWEPIMRVAAAIVTERGGRTSHAAIVARELGIPAIVGAAGALERIREGAIVTVSCAEGENGHVYDGRRPYRVETIDPSNAPRPKTKIMLNVGDPDQAMKASLLPSDGVGLARMEFIFASWVRVHPLALTRYESLAPEVKEEVDRLTKGYASKTDYFVDVLSQGIATIAAAFHPREVILRLSDFKTNEYARLLGGAQFEPVEENPMLGFRGASRYYHERYKDGFALEVAAIKRVRATFGFTNLKVMVPFCRTPAEGRRVLEAMREGGLERGRDGLEVYVMAEIPSNVLLAKEFAEIFDGFSIGSNDLTQLTLGIDRDSTTVAPLFDERNEAVKWSCAKLIGVAHAHGRKVGICGQAPSDYPDFAAFLVEQGIDSLSLSPDALVRTAKRVLDVERHHAG